MQAICDDGLDEHFSPDDGLFGRGLYFTDAASKANQYGTPVRAGHGNYPAFKGLFPMFVVRVCLGAPVGSEQNPVRVACLRANPHLTYYPGHLSPLTLS